MLDSGSVAPKRSDFALAAVLDRIAAQSPPARSQKNLRFDCPMTSIFVNSDPALLERIVENLVSNAVRYTTDGSVTIYAEQIGGVVRLSVADTGIGIPKEALDKIFEEYFQYDNPARNIKKGLGLGLAIVKRLSDLLMHPIQVSSVLGEGSIFAVDVPLATAAALTEGSKATATPAQDVRKLAVLFIDDDMAVADSLSMVLRGAGLQAVSASDGDGAVKRCADGFLPDVVLSDYRMPNENGLIVVDRVRRSLGFDVPVIMMTGDTSLRHIQEQNVENLTVVQKPVDPDALIELIHEMARRRGGARTTPNA